MSDHIRTEVKCKLGAGQNNFGSWRTVDWTGSDNFRQERI